MDESKEIKNRMEEIESRTEHLKKLTRIIPQVVDTLLPADEILFTSFIGALTDSYCEEHGLDAVQILNDVIEMHTQLYEALNEITEE